MTPQEISFQGRSSASLRLRPLIEDGSVMSRGTTLWNGEAGYRLSDSACLVVEVFKYLRCGRVGYRLLLQIAIGR